MSDQFSEWIQTLDQAIISELTKTDMRCLLARKRRTQEFDRETENKIFATFENDLATGHLYCPSIQQGCFDIAIQLIDCLPKIPLRTLDALHLAVAQQLNVDSIATADAVFATAARALGFQVITFMDN